MMAGFVLLGRVTALRPAGPWLVLVAGAASIAAGLFRRDHMLLDSLGFAGESWHNQVHDVVGGVAYGAMLAAPLVLARRWRDDRLGACEPPVQVLALVSAAALAVFASRIAGPYNGVVQWIAVTLALAAEILIARRMLILPVTGSAAGPGVTPGQGAPVSRAAETLSSLPAGRTSPGPERRSRAPTECTPAGMIIDLSMPMHAAACSLTVSTLPAIIAQPFLSFWQEIRSITSARRTG